MMLMEQLNTSIFLGIIRRIEKIYDKGKELKNLNQINISLIKKYIR